VQADDWVHFARVNAYKRKPRRADGHGTQGHLHR
jgi:hypothetical protein